jgi:hypothetical protein
VAWDRQEAIVDGVYFRGLEFPRENMVQPNIYVASFRRNSVPPPRPARARTPRSAGLENGLDTELNVLPIQRPYLPDGVGVAARIRENLDWSGIRVTLVTKSGRISG